MLLVDWPAASGLWGSCSPWVKGHYSWGHVVPYEEGQGKNKTKTNSGKPNYLVFLSVYFSGCLYQIKVARLLKYLQFRDYKSKLLRSMEDDDLLSDTGMHATSDAWSSFMIYQVNIESFVWQLCRWGWWQSAAAATGSGFSHLDGSNRWLPLTGWAPGSWPH